MRRASKIFLCCLLPLVILLGCDRQKGSTKPGPRSVDTKSVEDNGKSPLKKVEGTLTEARCYFTTGAVGGDHQYCAFTSMKANLPVGVLTQDGEFIYLAIEPRQLADYATSTIRVEGDTLSSDDRMLRPRQIWQQTSSGWTTIYSGGPESTQSK